MLLAASDAGDCVCDPFAGTRTTERVALANGRLCVSFDIFDYTTIKKKHSRDDDDDDRPTKIAATEDTL